MVKLWPPIARWIFEWQPNPFLVALAFTFSSPCAFAKAPVWRSLDFPNFWFFVCSIPNRSSQSTKLCLDAHQYELPGTLRTPPSSSIRVCHAYSPKHQPAFARRSQAKLQARSFRPCTCRRNRPCRSWRTAQALDWHCCPRPLDKIDNGPREPARKSRLLQGRSQRVKSKKRSLFPPAPPPAISSLRIDDINTTRPRFSFSVIPTSLVIAYPTPRVFLRSVSRLRFSHRCQPTFLALVCSHFFASL